MPLAVVCGRVMPGVMSPLRVSAKMRAAAAPLNLLSLEGHLSTSAHFNFVAVFFGRITVFSRARRR